MKSTTIHKQVIHPETGKRIRRIFVNGKGWFAWNTVYHTYNAVRNYEQLKEADRASIDFSKTL